MLSQEANWLQLNSQLKFSPDVSFWTVRYDERQTYKIDLNEKKLYFK